MEDEPMFEYTNEDIEKALSGYFTSQEPLVLREFPSKQKRQHIVLNIILNQFEKGRKYTEKEVNDILCEIYPDYVTLRRSLIDYKLMDRTRNCSEYWVKEKEN